MTRLACVAVCFGLLATGCAADLSSAEAHRMVARGALLLDVRSDEEFRARHLPGAVNIPVEDLQKREAELGARDRPIVVYCHTGARAGAAVLLLRRDGFHGARNLSSMSRWDRDPGRESPSW